MGRELKRKQAKKEGKSLKEIKKESKDSSNDLYSFLKIFGIIAFIIILLYLVIGIFFTKDIDWFSNKNKEEIKVSNTILAKNSFKQTEEAYYVYYYNYNEENKDVESAIISKMYNQKIYRVNTNDDFNSNYISDTGSGIVDSIEKLKIKSPTLIKIESEKITEYKEGFNTILEYLS